MTEDQPESKILLAEAIWNLLPDKDAFRAKVAWYIGKSYPNNKPVRFERPFIIMVRKDGENGSIQTSTR
jgi:hypothetical protein